MALPAGITPVRRIMLSDDVFETLKSLIMEHRLAPEARLNIDALARELRVSPTPVREALARLESEGLVRKRPLAGYTVSPLLTRAEFADLFAMRMLLEPAAARWAAERAGDRERAAVVTEAAMAYAATDAGGHTAFTAQDARFHALVATVAGHPLLADAIARLHAHLHIHRLYFPYAETASTGREHERIAAAVREADPDAAETAMRDHLTAARSRHLIAFG
jgi:DNA-binding GntR family transcriptional regulator